MLHVRRREFIALLGGAAAVWPLVMPLEEREADMRGLLEKDDPEISFRRGYEHGATEVFFAIERFLDPTTREVVRNWIEKDIYVWRMKAMLGYPPVWRLRMLAGPRSAGSAPLSP
jgi:hypothetical protein